MMSCPEFGVCNFGALRRVHLLSRPLEIRSAPRSTMGPYPGTKLYVAGKLSPLADPLAFEMSAMRQL
ncbi:unnamed protein product, partial [Iphiclides podalirius]